MGANRQPAGTDATPRSFLQDSRVMKARDLLLQRDGWVLALQMELTAIPAPPFGEEARGDRILSLFQEMGLRDVDRDEVGNVLAWSSTRPPTGQESGGDAPLILSAHQDTVFPSGTDVAPRQVGNRILAPGIADDGRGLAALLALAWVTETTPLPPLPPILFVATVGEEGSGDLRGVRHLYREGGRGRTAGGFISLDGVGLDQVINQGVGSTRIRVRLSGPGGHSWTDWGTPNPIHALGRIVAAVETLPLPSQPRTTATVARIGGGKSINAIPQEAWMEVDLRSRGEAELQRLEEGLRAVCRREWDDQPGGTSPPLALEVEELGHRPAGATDPDQGLVRAALAATRELGVEATLTASSTDANLPMSLGMPAITLGAGGEAGGIHTLDEWYSNEEGPEGILRALLTLLHLGS